MSQYQWVEGVDVCLANHEYYHTKEDVLRQIKENEKRIAEIKRKLFAMVCGNVKDLFVYEEDCHPIERARIEFDYLFDAECEGLEYLIAHNVELQLVADNWDKMNSDIND